MPLLMPRCWNGTGILLLSCPRFQLQAYRDLKEFTRRRKLPRVQENGTKNLWERIKRATIPSTRSSIGCPPVILICNRSHAVTKRLMSQLNMKWKQTSYYQTWIRGLKWLSATCNESFTCSSYPGCLLLFSNCFRYSGPMLLDLLVPCSNIIQDVTE